MARTSRKPTASLRVEALETRDIPSASSLDRLIVTFDANVAADVRTAELNEPELVESVTSLGFDMYRLELDAGTDVQKAITFFAGQPGVTMAGEDSLLASAAIPNDPNYSALWGLQTISAPTGWNANTGTGQTIVAVIDTGVDYTHPDLAANMWVNPNAAAADKYGYDFANNDSNPMDDNSHGTHVAGIIGGVGNNGKGITGVAQKTKIMALKFMNAAGSGYTSDAIRAMDYAISHGAKILNNSWGGDLPDAFLAQAIQRAQAAGVIVVVAAGNETANDDVTKTYPTEYARTYNNVIAVAATDRTDKLAWFSNYGAQTVLVAAPGVDIYSTLPGGGYGYKSGTSMATPMIAGALSLLWDQHPTWTYSQIINKLKASVDTLTSLQGKTVTGGRLNLAKLLDAPATVVPPTTPPVTSPPSASPPATSPPTTSMPTTDTLRWTGAGSKITTAVFSGTTATNLNSVRVTFDKRISVPSFTASDVKLIGPNGAVIPITSVTAVTNGSNAVYDVAFATQTTAGAYSLTVGPDIYDVTAQRMDQNGNGINNEAGDAYKTTVTLGSATSPPPASPITPAPTTPGTRTSYSATGLPLAIKDLVTNRITFNVTDNVKLSDLRLQIDLTHTRMTDLNIRLRGPDNTLVTLYNRQGLPLSNITFADSATLTLGGTSLPAGSLVKPGQALSAFNGKLAKGTWTVEIFDLVAGSTGSVKSATLSFATASTASQALGIMEIPSDAMLPTLAPFVGQATTPGTPTASADDISLFVRSWAIDLFRKATDNTGA